MSWVIVGAAVAGAVSADNTADKAGDKASEASGRALNESTRQYNQTRADTAVARRTSDDAMLTLSFLLGLRDAPTDESIAKLQSDYEDLKAKKDRYMDHYNGMSGGSGSNSLQGTGFGFGSGTGIAGADSLFGGSGHDGGKSGLAAEINDIKEKMEKAKKKLKSAQRMQGIAGRYPDGLDSFIKEQPGYQFGMDEGMKGVTNVLAANGQGQGGKAMKAALRYGQDYASTKVDQHLGRLLTLANYGPAAANTTAAAGQNLANASLVHAGNMGNIAYNNADARTGAINSAINTGLSLYSYNSSMPGSTLPPPGANTIPQGPIPNNIGATA